MASNAPSLALADRFDENDMMDVVVNHVNDNDVHMTEACQESESDSDSDSSDSDNVSIASAKDNDALDHMGQACRASESDSDSDSDDMSIASAEHDALDHMDVDPGHSANVGSADTDMGYGLLPGVTLEYLESINRSRRVEDSRPLPAGAQPPEVQVRQAVAGEEQADDVDIFASTVK